MLHLVDHADISDDFEPLLQLTSQLQLACEREGLKVDTQADRLVTKFDCLDELVVQHESFNLCQTLLVSNEVESEDALTFLEYALFLKQAKCFPCVSSNFIFEMDNSLLAAGDVVFDLG